MDGFVGSFELARVTIRQTGCTSSFQLFPRGGCPSSRRDLVSGSLFLSFLPILGFLTVDCNEVGDLDAFKTLAVDLCGTAIEDTEGHNGMVSMLTRTVLFIHVIFMT